MVRTPQWVKGAIAAVGEGRIHRLQKTISKPPLTMPHKSEAKSERYCGGMENIKGKLSQVNCRFVKTPPLASRIRGASGTILTAERVSDKPQRNRLKNTFSASKAFNLFE